MTEILNQDSRPQDGQGLTREAWLHRAIEAFRPRFTQIGLPLPARLHVSVGFGYSSRAESKHILGQCWARRASAWLLRTCDGNAYGQSGSCDRAVRDVARNQCGLRREFNRADAGGKVRDLHGHPPTPGH